MTLIKRDVRDVAIVCWILTMPPVNNAVIINQFATKNTYNASNIDSPALEGQYNNIHGCQPIQVILVARHGIRYPGSDDLESGPKIINELRNCGAHPAILNDLELVLTRDLPKTKSKELSTTGALEQHNLGFRIASRYLHLFSTAKQDEVLFKSSSSKRAKDSCINFQKGFVKDHRLNLSTSITEEDHMIRFFDFCLRYVKGVRKNKTALQEQYDFEEMKKQEISRNIGRRLNITELNVTAEDLNSLYKIAACEVGIAGSHYWLDLLGESDLEILEYREDLESYWELGSGYPINYEQSCPLVADIFQQMDRVISGQTSVKGVFYFGHAETLVPLATLLGLFQGVPLRANNFKEQKGRSFKTSHISPFSANLGFVLHRCNSTTQTSDLIAKDMFKIEVLFKERTIQLPSVCSTDLCPYSRLRNYFSDYIDRCDFDKKCSLKSSVIRSKASILEIIPAIYPMITLMLSFCT